MFDLQEILAATGGSCRSLQNVEFTGINTDSRTIKSGELFVALSGENFDGHNYCAKALALGAAGVLVSHAVEGLPQNAVVIKTDDTLKAYQLIAKAWRDKQKNLKVVAVTGSNGKTSTKDLIAACLACKYNVVKTEANFNNEIGLPKTLLNIKNDTEIAVVKWACAAGADKRPVQTGKPRRCRCNKCWRNTYGNFGQYGKYCQSQKRNCEKFNGSSSLRCLITTMLLCAAWRIKPQPKL